MKFYLFFSAVKKKSVKKLARIRGEGKV